MADAQIFRGAVSDAPAVYTVPSSAEFTLKAVNALYTDNGAAGDWLPCVTIVSDSGHTIARACDQAVKVTAGDDAEVSWFPGVKHFAATTPSGGAAPDYLLLQGTTAGVTNPAIGDNDHAKFTYANRQTNDDTLWTYIFDAGGFVKEVDTSAHGRYQLFAQGHWAANAAAYEKTMVIDTFGTGGYGMSPDVKTTSTTVEDMFVGAMDFVTSGTMQIDVNVAVSVAGPINFVCVYFWILRWAT